MRNLSSAQQARLFSSGRQTFSRVRIADPSGTLVDYTIAGGSTYDWVNTWHINANVDEMVVGANVEFFRENDAESLAPYLTPGSEAIKAGRRITIEAAVIEWGESLDDSDFWLLFDGYVDGWETQGTGSTMTLVCRDEAGLITDEWTIQEATYGNTVSPVPVQTVMQQILNEEFSGSVTFTTLGNPDFGIVEYVQSMESMHDAIKANFDLIGWLFRSRYDDGSGAFRFEMLEPDRDQTTPVFSISPSDYYDIPTFGESSIDIRNRGVIKWGGGKITVRDTNSIAEYGRQKTIVLNASQDSQINTEAKALNLITAVVSDLAQPLATQQAVTPLFPPVEINDLYRFTPNTTLYSQNQDMAVVAFTHSWGPDGSSTTMSLRGRPTGGVTRWESLRDRLEEETVEEAETPDLTTDDIQFYYTTPYGSVGFDLEGAADTSLGGWASTTRVSEAVNGIFRKVSETERVATVTLYRSIAVINESAAPVPIDWECVLAYLDLLNQLSGGGVAWSIVFDPQGVYPAAELFSCISPNEETAPDCSPPLTFVSPDTFDHADVLGGTSADTIPAGYGRIIHIRLEVSSGAATQTTDDDVVFQSLVPSSSI